MLVWSNSVYYCSLLLLLFSHSVVSDSLWSPWTAAHQVSLSFTLSWSLIKLMSIESVMPSNHLILCRPILLLPSIFSSIRVFSNDLAFCTRRPKSIGASASASVLPMNSQSWFPLELTGLISLHTKGLLRVFSSPTVQKHQFLVLNFFYSPTLLSIHDYWKNHKSDYMDLCWQSDVSSLLFNMLSRLVIAFLPRSKHLLIS